MRVKSKLNNISTQIVSIIYEYAPSESVNQTLNQPNRLSNSDR